MRRIIPLFVSLLLALVLASPAAAITNGQPDGSQHPYVGMVYNDTYLCSGTLIAPTVFVTAAHCTAAFEAGGSQVYVTFAPEADFDPANALPGTPFTYPGFCIGCAPGLPGFDTDDVGVVVLDAPYVDVGFGQLPYAGQVSDLENGTILTAVGYGVRGFERGGGPPQPSGIAVRYVAPVQFINDNNRIGDMFIKHSANPAQAKGGTCFGDSGGPIFAPDQATVLGATSFGTNSVCAGTGYAQRLDRPEILEWIASFIVW